MLLSSNTLKKLNATTSVNVHQNSVFVFFLFLWNLKTSVSFTFVVSDVLCFLSLSGWSFAFRVLRLLWTWRVTQSLRLAAHAENERRNFSFLCSFFRECTIRKRSLSANSFESLLLPKVSQHMDDWLERCADVKGLNQIVHYDEWLWVFRKASPWMNLVFVTCCVWCCTRLHPLARWGYSTLPQQTFPI